MNNLNLQGYNPNVAKYSSYGGLGAGVGSLLGSLFGNQENPYQEAAPIYNQYASQAQSQFNPYIQQGQDAGKTYNTHLSNLLENPTELQDSIASHYQQSPYAHYLNNQAMDASNYAAQLGGVAGTPQQQTQLGGVLAQINGQDLNNYVNNGMNAYNTGLGGMSHLNDIGFQGAGSLANLFQKQGEDLASLKANEAIQNNQNSADMFGGLGQIGGSLAQLLWL